MHFLFCAEDGYTVTAVTMYPLRSEKQRDINITC